MATTVTSTERATTSGVDTGVRLPFGGGPHGNGKKNGGGDDSDGASGFSPERGLLGMWIALGGILMMFVALSSAYVVRLGTSQDPPPVALPNVLWLSTALILASSATFEFAKRSLVAGLGLTYRRWIIITFALGLGFVSSQLFAWRRLVESGVYLATNPHSSFFYVLTGTHGIHLLGGLLALLYLLVREWKPWTDSKAEARRRLAASVVGVYWHFMDGLWLYLFLLLTFWR